MSNDAQDLTVQREALAALGVDLDRVYVDHGLTGSNRARPGLREAMAACRTGDTLVVTKLDRLARSVPDARDIVDELTARGVRLNPGGSVHDPTDPIGRLLFTVLSVIAEFEADLTRARTREGMAVAKAKGRLRGKQPKRSPKQEALLVQLWSNGKHTTLDLAELFEVARSTVYRTIQRGGADLPVDPAAKAKGRPHSTVRTRPLTAEGHRLRLRQWLQRRGSLRPVTFVASSARSGSRPCGEPSTGW